MVDRVEVGRIHLVRGRSYVQSEVRLEQHVGISITLYFFLVLMTGMTGFGRGSRAESAVDDGSVRKTVDVERNGIETREERFQPIVIFCRVEICLEYRCRSGGETGLHSVIEQLEADFSESLPELGSWVGRIKMVEQHFLERVAREDGKA